MEKKKQVIRGSISADGYQQFNVAISHKVIEHLKIEKEVCLRLDGRKLIISKANGSGLVRKVSFGKCCNRVCIPPSLVRVLGVSKGDSMEVYLNGDEVIYEF